MKRRFTIYGFGVVLGLILAWGLFLRGRNMKNYTSWTPNNRILEEIRLDTSLVLNQNNWCEIQCLGFSSITYDALLNSGNVVFSESDVTSWPRTYLVEFKTDKNGTLRVNYAKTKSKHFSILWIKKETEKVETPIICDC